MQLFRFRESKNAFDALGEDGLLGYAGDNCEPGEDTVISGEWGELDCSASGAWYVGNELVVDYALRFDPDTFGGPRNVFFDAKGGPGDEEPRLGWTHVGTWTVVEDPPEEPEDPVEDEDDATDSADDDVSDDDDVAPEAPAEEDGGPIGGQAFGCGTCSTASGPATGGLALLPLLAWVRRRR